MRTNQVLCIIFRDYKGKLEFLLLKRIPEKGSFWQPPSGGVEESDESLEAAALREVAEETGLRRKDIIQTKSGFHSFIIDKHYLTGEPISPLTETAFAFKVRNGWNPRMDNNIYQEHEEFKWVSFDEALHLLKWQNNKDAFKKLKKCLIN